MGLLSHNSVVERESTFLKNIPALALGVVVITQFSAGVWWAAELSSQVKNQEEIVNEKLTKIENRLDGTSLIQITKSELNSKLELFKLQTQTNNKNLLLFKQESKEKYIQLQKIQEQLNLRIGVLQKQITSLEKTINLSYINNSKNR